MPTHRSTIPKAPQPTRICFDPYNSTATGHQRAENRLASSTFWRDSRSYKLGHQFGDTSGRGGAKHLSDLVGAGSENYGKDGRKDTGDWEVGAPGLREKGWQDIRGLMGGGRKRKAVETEDHFGSHEVASKKLKNIGHGSEIGDARTRESQPPTQTDSVKSQKDGDLDTLAEIEEWAKQPPQIFRGLTMYLNGSTAPLVSDHKLKQMFVSRGGNSSIALGRRTVTHVILGKTCGGGLASGKLQKEVKTVGGKGIKYVTAQWVLDSVAKGVRQSEGKYMPDNVGQRIGGSGQRRVIGLLDKKLVRDKAIPGDTTKIGEAR